MIFQLLVSCTARVLMINTRNLPQAAALLSETTNASPLQRVALLSPDIPARREMHAGPRETDSLVTIS